MEIAIQQARLAGENGEVPVGAIVVDGTTGVILAEAQNRCERAFDPTAHAEIEAIRQACQIKNTPRLPACDLYVTLEPCTMCASAISHARIRRIYFGAYDPKGGGVDHGARFFTQSTCHHKPEVYGGIRERECGELLVQFFKEKR